MLRVSIDEELVRLVERGEDKRATRIIAQVITQLHSVGQHAPRDGLVPLDRWFAALFAKAARTGWLVSSLSTCGVPR